MFLTSNITQIFHYQIFFFCFWSKNQRKSLPPFFFVCLDFFFPGFKSVVAPVTDHRRLFSVAHQWETSICSSSWMKPLGTITLFWDTFCLQIYGTLFPISCRHGYETTLLGLCSTSSLVSFGASIFTTWNAMSMFPKVFFCDFKSGLGLIFDGFVLILNCSHSSCCSYLRLFWIWNFICDFSIWELSQCWNIWIDCIMIIVENIMSLKESHSYPLYMDYIISKA